MRLDDRRLVDEWYRRDDNAVPAEYVLQPRRGAFEAYEVWEPVEQRLREALARAAEKAGLGEAARRKYRASATELEIMKGAVNVPDAREHVFGFFRTITNLDDVKAALPGDAAERCSTSRPGETGTAEAWAAQQKLKDLLTAEIGEAERLAIRGAVDGRRAGPRGGDRGAAGGREPCRTRAWTLPNTTNLCEAVWQRLSRVIAAADGRAGSRRTRSAGGGEARARGVRGRAPAGVRRPAGAARADRGVPAGGPAATAGRPRPLGIGQVGADGAGGRRRARGAPRMP